MIRKYMLYIVVNERLRGLRSGFQRFESWSNFEIADLANSDLR